ncbi:MAG: cation:dicarboxylase symporter family transporter [Proteobacteria bacterium]|nr:cation:dicarboxylase symporter family transporter [Pseudomonadota bacterium]
MNDVFFKGVRSLKQRSVQTLLILAIYVLIANYLPLVVHQLLYTASLLIKDILIWMMPLTVGFFIANAVMSFEKRAPLFIFLLVLFEAFSNLSSVWYAFATANFAAELVPSCDTLALESNFNSLWRLQLTSPAWWSASKGSIVGLLLGCVTAFSKETFLKRGIKQGKEVMEWILTKVFARLIPLFVLGFAAHMYQTKLLDHVVAHYAVLVLWLTAFLFLYLIFLFALGAGASFRSLFLSIKNLLPAGGVALLSGCSLSTMPWTIEGAAKNLQNPGLAKAIIPATTNIQQIGDCITQTFLCFLIYRHFYGHNPDVMTWLNFSIIFVLARFATAAVLGGAIFVMLPVYETYLSFNAEMIAIILTLNVILDPLITSCNVMANGALCRVFERVWSSAQTVFAFSRS